MKFGDNKEFYRERQKEILKEEAMLRYKDKLKVWLSLSVGELKNTPLYKMIKGQYPDLDENATLDEVRIIKLFDKAFVESSFKALEMTWKLDGSMNDVSVKVNFDDLNKEIGDIE